MALMIEESLEGCIMTELAFMGFGRIARFEEVKRSPRHAVARVYSSGKSMVAKWFAEGYPLEIAVYGMLASLGIPTLPVLGATDRILVLEDLGQSKSWRLAAQEDLENPETGEALAEWYKELHEKGERFVENGRNGHPSLSPWPSAMTVANLARAGSRFGLDDSKSWRDSICLIEPLKARYLQCRQTFNYDDFALENLALSCDGGGLRAVVFDYDRFCLGARFSDWRNVTCSLSGESLAGFKDGYGDVDGNERVLDEPLSTLFGILQASDFDRKPSWAEPLIADARSGKLLEQSTRALR